MTKTSLTYRMVLERHGHKIVMLTRNRKELIALCSEECRKRTLREADEHLGVFDDIVVLLDYMTPNMNGIQLAREEILVLNPQ